MSLQGPDADQMKVIAEEINEHEGRMEHNLRLIKSWQSCQPHLPQSSEDVMLRMFLRGCKHDLERTKRKLDTYYSARTTMPELFAHRDPCSDEIQRAMDLMHAYPLPRLTPEGTRVTVHKLSDPDVFRYDPAAMLRYLLMLGDVRLQEETALSGDVFLFDVRHFRASHCVRLAASPLLRRMLVCVQSAYPQRLKQIHLIHAPVFMDKLLSVFKALMKEKMRNRFYTHSNLHTLHDYIPRDILPKEYGGKCSQDLRGQWRKKLESYQHWFAQQDTVKSDESRRPVKLASIDRNMFGCDGAFRRLSID